MLKLGINNVSSKKCNKCQIIKDINNFSMDKSRFDMKTTQCQECRKDAHTRRDYKIRHGIPTISNLFDRFWDKVNVKGSVSECWEWKGGIYKKLGYGKFNFNNTTKYSHRASYELTYGNIESDKFVCHTCDNKICVNPGHLFLGTAKDNVQDMIKKGRKVIVCGENSGMSKLSNKERDYIRINPDNLTRRELALRFNVSYNTIRYNERKGL